MYEKATSEYFELVMTELRTILSLEGDDRADLGQSIMNEILNNGEPITIDVQHSRRDLFIGNKLFRPMAEIMYTVETIEEISKYVRVFPHRKQNLSRLNYLKYHVSNYLNEIYILKNRLIAYITSIQRAYAKSHHTRNASKAIEPLFKLISEVFKAYIDIRGSHVHEKRNSNKEFSRLSTLELLSRSNDEFGVIMSEIYMKSFREIRKTWILKMEKDVKAIHLLLEIYFSTLKDIIFPENHLHVPDNYS